MFMHGWFRLTKHPPLGFRLTKIQFNRLGGTEELKWFNCCRNLLLVTVFDEKGGQCNWCIKANRFRRNQLGSLRSREVDIALQFIQPEACLIH